MAVDFAEFDRLVQPFRERSAVMKAKYGFAEIDAQTATVDEIAAAERELGLVLPAQYKTFMVRYGGGQFGTVELFPIGPATGPATDVASVNRDEFPDRSFVAVAPVGTGDFWGFLVADGRCGDAVWFHFHDGDDPELAAADFLEFVVARGLRPLL